MNRAALSVAVLAAILSDIQFAQGTAQVTSNVRVENIRIGLAPDKTRLVFDLSGPVKYSVSTLDQPRRIQIELQDSHSQIDPDTLALQGTPIRAIQASEITNAVTYVVDVDSGTQAQAFLLKPYAGRQHRLVIDFHNSTWRPSEISGSNQTITAAITAPDNSSRHESRAAPGMAKTSANPPETRDYSGAWSGFVSLDARIFFQSPKFAEQRDQNVSAAFKPEYYVDWADGTQQFGFSPFFRYDAQDDQRTHADIRELYWQAERERITAKAGIDVVFWGVTESQHLVDIINQTDLVENIDGEEKLGQPMLNVDYLSDWGNWNAFVLPYFRERTFPGKHGRLRTEPAVSTSNPLYESGSEEKHVDFALRWSHNIGDWDLGLAHFTGTGREPYLQVDTSAAGCGWFPITPRSTRPAWTSRLPKAPGCGSWSQSITRTISMTILPTWGALNTPHLAWAGRPRDLGWLLENQYDERGDEAPNGLASDIYLGLRLTANDVASTMALAGIIYDTDTEAVFGNIEASRRLNEDWSLDLELRFTTNTDDDQNLYFVESDDYLGIALRRYF
jgi:hypothetical protein